MNIIASICILLVLFPILDSYELERNSSVSDRQGRWFPLFTIIRFPNSECSVPGGISGTCFTRRECNDLKGLSTTSCASKRGVCCVVTKTCGGSTDVNNTYFSNFGYPSSSSGGSRCSITIKPCNSEICQLRVDFLDLVLAQPNDKGVCNDDSLTISGGSSRVPVICGENDGQHVYVNFNNQEAITLTITTRSSVEFNRRWNIKLTQLACNCPMIAPSGCLMYYTGTSGTVKSFNYGTTANPATDNSDPPIIGTREMVNLNYGVCIRMEADHCTINWSKTSNTHSFTVTNLANGPLVDTPGGALNGASCTSDFVVIPNPIKANGNPYDSDRFCGVSFLPVSSSSNPFVLTVVTNQDEQTPNGQPMMDSANRGFQLNYKLQRCT